MSVSNGVTTSGGVDGSGTQVTVSEGHPFPGPKGSGLTDLGGEFSTVKSYCTSKPTVVSGTVLNINSSTQYTRAIRCPVYPVVQSVFASGLTFPYPPDLRSSNAELDKLGATAISRCAPGNSPADVVTFLGELYKDKLPALIGSQLWKSQTDLARKASLPSNAGSEYLNLQFGWAPLVRDITSFANALVKADEVLSQFERDAGKVVRRRYRFPVETSRTETDITSQGGLAAFPTNTCLSASAAKQIRVREIERRRWFSGAFTYHLPAGYDSRLKMAALAARAQFLLGANLSPDTLWELAPWSWAVDWFSNTGDVIHNVARFGTQGLIMRYGYMMEHTIVTDTYTCEGVSSTSSNSLIKSGSHIAPMTLVTETKVRRQANPFGFGLSWEGLSLFQTSILAALGITRRR